MYRALGAGVGTLTAGGTLAFTGSNPLLWVLVAVAMLVIGFVLLRLTMVRGQAALAGDTVIGPPSAGVVRSSGRR